MSVALYVVIGVVAVVAAVLGLAISGIRREGRRREEQYWQLPRYTTYQSMTGTENEPGADDAAGVG